MLARPKRFSEALGLWAGSVIAPVFAVGSALRRARVVHPRGIHFQAQVQAVQAVNAPFASVAQGLSGDALVRLSAGLFRTERGLLPDILGMSIRFRTSPRGNFAPTEGSQDLLLLTSRRLWTLPLDALKTDQQNFLNNIYYGVSPFEIAGQPNMLLRVVPITTMRMATGTSRYQAIRSAVQGGDVRLRLEAASQAHPNQWFPLVEIRMVNEVAADPTVLEFWPFRTGQGIRPQGFIQFSRPVPYLLSQYARMAFGPGDMGRGQIDMSQSNERQPGEEGRS